MKKLLAFAISLIFVFSGCKKEKETFSFYVGTYTNGESEGIYQYNLDAEGRFSEQKLVAKTESPSFLAFSEDKKFLVAVNETSEDGVGDLESYKVVKDSLIFVNKVSSGGAHPCFVTIDKNNHVYAANYTGGNLSVSSLNINDGILSNIDIEQHEGKGTTSRQEAPHVHSVWINKSTDEVISIDLGTNELWFSTFNNKTQKLEPTTQGKLVMEDGAGPRHGTFHPKQEDWFYVFNELNSTITLVNKEEGLYKKTFSASTLPTNFEGDSSGADIHISSDGKFLYASNRGHNSIAIFKIDESNGDLKLVGHESVKGNWPRNFALSPDENFLLVANQYSNNIVSFKRNKETGMLTFVDEVKASSPVCVLF